MSDLLKELTGAYGPSANEKAVANIIQNEICRFVDEVKVDALGNLKIKMLCYIFGIENNYLQLKLRRCNNCSKY
ncbi:MAG: hypothetical protein PWQ60_2618 [Thermoanaerobacteraceae bacterium]|jgi:hypothetical protein|nr:hypothetical protein [Thermoanaerobacteraceae bacterium]